MKHPIDPNALSVKLEPLTQMLAKPPAPLTIDTAVQLLRDVHLCISSIEEFRIWMKWALGFVVNNARFEHGTADDLISVLSRRLWEEHSIRASKPVLYECQRVCRIFNNDTAGFGRWLEEMKIALGRGLYWSDVLKALFGGRSNPRVIGREEADRRDFNMAEEGVEALERILIRACEGDAEAQGVIEGVRQTLIGWSVHTETSSTLPRDADYLRFVRRFGCAVCEGPSEAHHAFGYHPMADKSSDYTSIPLCGIHHSELHRHGRGTFETRYEINIIEIAYNLMHRYHTGAWASMKLTQAG